MDPLHRDPWFYVFVAALFLFLFGAKRAAEIQEDYDYLNRSGAVIYLRKAGVIE